MLPGFHCCSDRDCAGCPGEYVCRCLKITEGAVLSALAAGASSLRELQRRTGAGDGCTACHVRLMSYLEKARGLQPLAMA